MAEATYNKLTLSSGRVVDIIAGTVGLHVDDYSGYSWDAREFYSGHDDSHPTNYPEGRAFDGEAEQWTDDERRELAEFMAARWLRWADRNIYRVNLLTPPNN